MFCALNGATDTPCRASQRQMPAVTTLLPASEVVPATRGAYVISAANGSWSNREQPRIRATRRASAYCAKLNKTMVEEDFNASDFGFGFGDRYTLRFSCALAAAAN